MMSQAAAVAKMVREELNCHLQLHWCNVSKVGIEAWALPRSLLCQDDNIVVGPCPLL